MTNSSPADVVVFPSSHDAEQAVLGSALINPAALGEIGDLQARDFYFVRHELIYAAMLAVQDKGDGLDVLTLTDELRSSGKLAEVGGAAYLVDLSNNTPTHIHVRTYADIVQRCAVRRRLMVAAQEIGKAALDGNAPLVDILGRAEAAYLTAATMPLLDDTISIGSIASQRFDDMEYKQDHPEFTSHIATGYPSLDKLLSGGPANGDLVIVAGRPSMGKTALAVCIALNMAKQGLGVGLFSLEMKPEQLYDRMCAIESNLNSQRFVSGSLTEQEWKQFTLASASLSQLPIFFDGSQRIKIDEIAVKSRKMLREKGIKAILIDYLGLMIDGDPEHETIEIGRVTRKAKLLAQELNMPVYLLAQLNRNLESRSDKRPMLSDLRQSGSIEQDADIVLAIYRDEVYNENSQDRGNAEILIRKHRNGPTGMVKLVYGNATTKFSEKAK